VDEERPVDEERSPERISRRKALKRIGAAGAAAAWTAPLLSSLRTPAFAASVVCGPACPDFNCGAFQVCGSGGIDICVCDQTIETRCFCWANFFCSDPGATACASSSDCPTGWACVTTCCGQTCAPDCGLVRSTEGSGPTAAGN
jgi:hypothetical protein